jgi:hypothetical protein
MIEAPKTYFYVRVAMSDGQLRDVGPFEAVSSFLGGRNSAVDWVYLQMGMLKAQFPEATLIKHRWNYREQSGDIFSDDAVVDIKVEMAGFVFETIQLRAPNHSHVVGELIEPAIESKSPF